MIDPPGWLIPTGSAAKDALSVESIRLQLQRILDSHLFASSESLRRMLRFVVDRTLQGKGDELKEYLLGVEVFDRGEQFDPRLDSIVRVQASKIRSKLREYYETAGQQDPVRIELPKGSYIPVFESLDQKDRSPVKADGSIIRRRSLVIGLASLLIIPGVYLWLHRSKPESRTPMLTRLTYDTGLTTDPALSPDGKLLAYASDRAGQGNLDIWVQPLRGGTALRLTHEASDEREPAFSPDSSQLVFHSERDGGGLYVISVLGGEPRKIASHGRRPHFSPDGARILYWIGRDVFGGIYVVPSAGGTPQQLHREFNHVVYPIWSPDGKSVLFWGNQSSDQFDVDWWASPANGGDAVRTGLWNRVVRDHKLEIDVRSLGDWIWTGDQLIFSAGQIDSVNLWRIPISPKTFQVGDAPRRVTFGAGQDALPSVSAEGRLVFANLNNNSQIWSLPIRISPEPS